MIYYTTFTPEFGTPGDICFLGEGKGRIYALRYKTGEAAFNLDVTNDISGITISKEDRTQVIGPSIPSGVIVTFTGGQTIAYTGIGGGVYKTPIKSPKSIIPINWRVIPGKK